MKLLLIEDNPADALLLEEHVYAIGSSWEVRRAATLAAALDDLAEHWAPGDAADAVLVDLGLPDSQGLASATAILEASSCPVIVLTGLLDSELGIQAVQRGAQDFLSKGELSPTILERALTHALERHALQDAVRRSEARLRELVERNVDGMLVVNSAGNVAFANPAAERLLGEERCAVGAPVPVSISVTAPVEVTVGDHPLEVFASVARWDGEPAHVISVRDLHERKEGERLRAEATRLGDVNARLERLATVDALTATLNRRGLEQALTEKLAQARRDASVVAVLLLDCDDFKSVNDQHGHAVGDLVLRETARRAQLVLRAGDVLGRIGGDEFMALLPGSSLADAERAAERIRLAVSSSHLVFDPEPVGVTVSIGVAVLERGAASLADALSVTRVGLSDSKRSGKNRVRASDHRDGPPSSLANAAASTMDTITDLLDRGSGLKVVRRAVRDLADAEKVGEELLVRGPPGLEDPSALFAFAADKDISVSMDLVCLRSCVSAWAQGSPEARVPAHVNILPQTLMDVPTETLLRLLEPLGPACVELDAHLLTHDPGELERRAAALRAAGHRVALDKVSEQPGSLSALLVFEPDLLKLHPNVITGAGSDPRRTRLLARLVTLGHALGARLVAEGVETAADEVHCRGLGIELGQGPRWGAAVELGSLDEA